MKRELGWLTVISLAVMVGAGVAAAEKKPSQGGSATMPASSSPASPEPAREGGYFQRGGADIARGYGQAGRQLGEGTAEFGKNFAQGDVGEAGRSFGRGAAGFGKNIGTGTARGFRNFASGLRNLGKKIDRSLSDDQNKKQP